MPYADGRGEMSFTFAQAKRNKNYVRFKKAHSHYVPLTSWRMEKRLTLW